MIKVVKTACFFVKGLTCNRCLGLVILFITVLSSCDATPPDTTNNNPIVQDIQVTAFEDIPESIALQAVIVEGSIVSYNIVAGPTNGTVFAQGSTVVYSPGLNYFGQDNFTYSVTDSNGTISASARVTIDIVSVNDAPIAKDAVEIIDEDTILSLQLEGSDVEGNVIYDVEIHPQNGTVSGSSAFIKYTPDEDFSGQDFITFKVVDSNGSSSLGLISITVRNVNDAPEAINTTVTILEDTSLSFELRGNDNESFVLDFIITDFVKNGTVSGTAPNLNYTPNANFNGTDKLLFRARDGEGAVSAIAEYTIIVQQVNDSPIAFNQTINITEDSDFNIILAGTDIDDSDISYTASQPLNGTLQGDPPSVIYTPNENFNGDDEFEFTVTDSSNLKDTGKVQLFIFAENDEPIITTVTTTFIIQEDSDFSFPISYIDPENDAVTLVFDVASNGNITIESFPEQLVYTPNENFSGSDFFRYAFREEVEGLMSAFGVINFFIVPVNDAPIVKSHLRFTMEDQSLTFDLDIEEVDGEDYAITLVQPDNGSIVLNDDTITLTPAANFFGEVTSSYSVIDTSGLRSETAMIVINVSSINDIPIAIGATVELTSVQEGYSQAFTLEGTDIESNNLTFQIVTSPSRGTLVQSGASVVYTVGLDFSDGDSFTFRVLDNENVFSEQTTTFITSSSAKYIDVQPALTTQAKKILFNSSYWSVENNIMWFSSDGKSWSRSFFNATLSNVVVQNLLLHDRKLWLFGLERAGGKVSNQVWTSTNGFDWSKEDFNMPWQSRWGYSLVSHLGQLLLVGGCNLNDKPFSDIWILGEDNSWNKLSFEHRLNLSCEVLTKSD